MTRPLQTLYTGQHRLQQGVAEVFRDWLPVVTALLLEVVVVAAWVGEAVEGRGVVGTTEGAEAWTVVDRTAGQGTDTKTQGESGNKRDTTQTTRLHKAPSSFLVGE